jgi:hypothetical protein
MLASGTLLRNAGTTTLFISLALRHPEAIVKIYVLKPCSEVIRCQYFL